MRTARLGRKHLNTSGDPNIQNPVGEESKSTCGAQIDATGRTTTKQGEVASVAILVAPFFVAPRGLRGAHSVGRPPTKPGAKSKLTV